MLSSDLLIYILHFQTQRARLKKKVPTDIGDTRPVGETEMNTHETREKDEGWGRGGERIKEEGKGRNET